MPGGADPSPLAEILAAEISARGRITFAEYMEACLYHPQCGYYAKAEQNARRDYITSADVTPVFGRLLARQFHEMWVLLERPETFWLVEAGAGIGELAKQILDFAAESLPEFYAALRYVAVERSAARRAAQVKSLETHTANGHFSSIAELPDEILCGCIFSNELFDAFAVHRVVQENGDLREVYVARGTSGFGDELGPLSSTVITEYLAAIDIVLREDQTGEVCLAACDWIRNGREAAPAGVCSHD